MRVNFSVIVAIGLVALAAPLPAAAYIGPGAGLSAIGSLVSLIGAVFLLLAGFVWYPVKRLLRGRASSGKDVSGRGPAPSPKD